MPASVIPAQFPRPKTDNPATSDPVLLEKAKTVLQMYYCLRSPNLSKFKLDLITPHLGVHYPPPPDRANHYWWLGCKHLRHTFFFFYKSVPDVDYLSTVDNSAGLGTIPHVKTNWHSGMRHTRDLDAYTPPSSIDLVSRSRLTDWLSLQAGSWRFLCFCGTFRCKVETPPHYHGNICESFRHCEIVDGFHILCTNNFGCH